MSDDQISEVLKERKKKFNSYRVNFTSYEGEITVVQENEISSVEKEIFIENDEIYFERKNEIPAVNKNEEQDCETVVVSQSNEKNEKKEQSGNVEATKSFNERMKQGFFGRRRR